MRYIEIQNSETAEKMIIDTYVSRYQRLGMGFLNSLKMNPSFVKHITLTQKIENYYPNILNPFFTKLRRYYGKVVYLWSAEVQEQRLEKYGDHVLHWHIIVGFDYGIEFGKADVLRLQRYWKYGNLDVKPVRRASMGYLMKYISKSLDVGLEYKIRRIGSSLIPAWLRMSWKKLQGVIDFFTSVCHESDQILSWFKWVYKGAYAVFEGQKVWLYRHPPSQWFLVQAFDDVSLLNLDF